MSSDGHFEPELDVALKTSGRDIPETMTHGYSLALDTTRRDLQVEMKKSDVLVGAIEGIGQFEVKVI